MKKLIGHTSQREKLLNLLSKDKLPQTLMFSGSAGIGKRLFATQFAKTLICAESPKQWNGCDICSPCKTFTAGNMPDFHLIECADKDNVTVEQIRTILAKVALKSYTGCSKVVIFNEAENLSVAAANILLKSLEEPTKDLYYILVTANPSRLPITINSRCQTWYFSDLNQEEMEQVLSNNPEILPEEFSNSDQEMLLKYAGGNLNNLAKIASNFPLLQEMNDAFPRIRNRDLAEVHRIIKLYGKNKEILPTVLFILQNICNTEMKLSSDPEEQHKLSIFLHNLNQAEYYFFSRNLNSNSLLAQILISAAMDEKEENSLIEDWVF